MKVDKLKETLPLLPVMVWNKETKEYDDKFVSPYSFIRDGYLYISSEHGDDAADYYGEYRGGYAWINPLLEAWAKSNNGYFEWQNAGCIVFNQ